MEPEKAMQIEHATTICLYCTKVIADFAKVPKSVWLYEMLEKGIYLGLEENGRADRIPIHKPAACCLSKVRHKSFQYVLG